ncbi:sugar ABC transporter permease [uncultured Plantibacter sp.]|uniref:carbohydrate ABC transporter permease n=1 Tax=uncultured Plantibacter sp. TaxID=293337 RepID=UPI0028D3A1D9|nr:sugar ABC transporter permease [uncultured Plantibacter sp.]
MFQTIKRPQPGPSSATRTPAATRRWRRARPGLVALGIALPAILVYLYFSWGPILSSLVMSVQNITPGQTSTWVGMENFSYVLSDPNLPQATLNTLLYTGLAILFGFPVPLALAVFISELRGHRWYFSALAYLPVMVPPVVAILLWKFFYEPSEDGVFNAVLGVVGIGPVPWLTAPTLAMPSIVLETTWAGAGTAVIIYIAALSSIPAELYEAAELDGAGIWRRVWHVALPQMRGIIGTMLLLQVIGTMQIFTEPFLFTGGGPLGATRTLLMTIYDYAFVRVDYGAATALSVLLAAVLAVFALVYARLTRRWSAS